MTPNDRYILKKHLMEHGYSVQCEHEVEVFRSKGKWILDTSDKEMIELLYSNGHLSIYPSEYVELLEELLIELLNTKNL